MEVKAVTTLVDVARKIRAYLQGEVEGLDEELAAGPEVSFGEFLADRRRDLTEMIDDLDIALHPRPAVELSVIAGGRQDQPQNNPRQRPGDAQGALAVPDHAWRGTDRDWLVVPNPGPRRPSWSERP
jgi:hypothetical protein